jgi:hypothetical protein
MQDEIAAVVREMREFERGLRSGRRKATRRYVTENLSALADRLSAASSSPGETRDVNAELLAALKDVVGDAAGEACDPLWIVRAEVISRGAIAIAKATASLHGPSSGEGWRPFSSAPRHGGAILAASKFLGQPTVERIWWDPGSRRWEGAQGEQRFDAWMHLPAPPQESSR